MFYLHNDRGFQIKFHNGYILSVMFGAHNYCDSNKTESGVESPNAEIAVWKNKKRQEFVTRGVYEAMGLDDPYDDVAGHLSVSQVMKIATFLESIETGSEVDNKIYFSKEAREC